MSDMKVILHVGAHRCATQVLQTYLADNRSDLGEQGIIGIGPDMLRGRFMPGLFPGALRMGQRNPARRANGRIALHLRHFRRAQTKALVMSDASLLGPLERLLNRSQLYPDAQDRLHNINTAFRESITDVMINIRSLECFWASALAWRLEFSHRLPNGRQLSRMTGDMRSWRDVITDISVALPQTRIHVFAHEVFAGRPDAQIAVVTGADQLAPAPALRLRESASLQRLEAEMPRPITWSLPEGKGRWMPFSQAEQSVLRERYLDDLMWLSGGADGLATLAAAPDATDTHQNNAAG